MRAAASRERSVGPSGSRQPVFLILLLAAAFVFPGAALAATAWGGDARAQVRLIGGGTGEGARGAAGIEFRYAPGWHGYWRTPGDAGIPPMLDWSGSRNAGPARVVWPAPRRLVVEGLQNGIYEGDFILPVEFDVADPQAASALAVAIDYAACSNICIPLHADLSLSLPRGPDDGLEAARIAAARASVPGAPGAAGLVVQSVRSEAYGSAAKLVVTLRSSTAPFAAPDLFVEGAGDGLPPAPAVTLADDRHTAILTIPLPSRWNAATPLTLTVVDGDRAAEFSGPSAPLIAATAPWLTILISALVGGLILNLMPCVLPILSIKLFGLARHAGAGRRAVRLGFLATAAGIMSCFLALATALVGLKLYGATLGWGIQFQQPWFLAGMAALTTVFAASFFEWLPIGIPRIFLRQGSASHGALAEAFLAGVFSTLLATPCSAPFVGTAVGFALAGGPTAILAVFLCLGLGMAMPFLAVALFPAAVAWLPRPGAWMLRLRQGLGLLLLGTGIWLLMILGSVSGLAAAVSAATVLAALLGFRFWITHRPRGLERAWPGVLTASLALAACAAALLPARSAGDRGATDAGWQTFDQAALDRAIAAGDTVLVDVTATWCLTCKVNDLAVLDTAPVQARLARPGVHRMRADWSRPDSAIAAYLQRFGRFGIPLDVVYGPGRPAGEALPELLSLGALVAALDHASGRNAADARVQDDTTLR